MPGVDPTTLVESSLATIDRIARRAAYRRGLSGADADDFVADVHLELLEDDCAIIRQWEGRASFATFLAVVVQRMLADWQRQASGKWRPSAEARRLGDAAVLLERLVRRHGRTIDEALPSLRGIDADMTAERARSLLDRLPERVPPPRLVALDPDAEIAARQSADARATENDARRLSEKTSRVVNETIAAMPLEDRMIMRMRFASGLTIASISRMLRVPQRPLYRRIEAMLARLRSALREAGVDARAIDELIGSPLNEMAFWKNDDVRTANESAEERWP